MSDDFQKCLTAAKVKGAKPGEKDYKLTDGGGLYLLIKATGGKLWRYKYRLHGKEQTCSIGKYPNISLPAARDRHAEARTMVANGEKPNFSTSKAVVVTTVADVISQWLSAPKRQVRENTLRQRISEVNVHIIPRFGQEDVKLVTRRDLSSFLIELSKKKPVTARNVRMHLQQIMEFAFSCGYIENNPVPGTNILMSGDTEHRKVIDKKKFPEFFKSVWVKAKSGDLPSIAMVLLVATASRKNEVMDMKWGEVDAMKWTVPADRMKNHTDHVVYIPTAVRDLLGRKNADRLVFSNLRGRAIPANSLNRIIADFGGGFHVHGFRSMFSTWANGTGEDSLVIESCLSHTPRDKTRMAYNRHDYAKEKKALIGKWWEHVCKLSGVDA